MKIIVSILAALCLGAGLPLKQHSFRWDFRGMVNPPSWWVMEIRSCPSRSLPPADVLLRAAARIPVPPGVLSMTNSPWNLITVSDWVLPDVLTWPVATNLPVSSFQCPMIPTTNGWGLYMSRVFDPLMNTHSAWAIHD